MSERFWVLDAANESNKIIEVSAAAGFPMHAIVDEKLGGCYIYVLAEGEENSDTICGMLNAGRLPDDCTGYRMADGEGVQHDGQTCPVHEDCDEAGEPLNPTYERTVKLARELATHVLTSEENREQLTHGLVTFIEAWEPPDEDWDVRAGVAALSTDDLQKEIEFAEAANDSSPEAVRWLRLLEEELDERKTQERLEAVANVTRRDGEALRRLRRRRGPGGRVDVRDRQGGKEEPMTQSKTYTVEEAVETVEEFILACHQEHPNCDKQTALNLEVSVYTWGSARNAFDPDRHPCVGFRVAEVSTWLPNQTGGGAGASWMQTEAPDGTAVCAQAERCVIALVEDWDAAVQDGEIQEEFWRLAFAMFGDELEGDFQTACMKHAPGIPYEEE